MPRYAKFLFAFLLTGLFCTWAGFFALLYVKGIPDFASVTAPLTPVIATESPLPMSPTPSTPSTPVLPDSSDTSASATPTSSLADATSIVATPSVTPAVPVDGLPVPSGLSVAEHGATFATLQWAELGNQVEQFVIYYSVDDFSYLNHGQVTGKERRYRVTELSCGTTYYFRVHPRTVDQSWLEASNIVTVTTEACEAFPTALPEPVPPTGTPTTELTQAMSCEDLASSDPDTQVLIIEAGPQCVPYFISLLDSKPESHLKAFYTLISSPAATDPLFTHVYDQLLKNAFQFEWQILEQLFVGLPPAIAACTDHARCADWETFILPALEQGDLYQCPDVEALDQAELLLNLPYANYHCTEAIAKQLASEANETTLKALLEQLSTEEQAWARRNAMRTLGRLAQQPATEPAHILVTETYSTTVQQTLVKTLSDEPAEQVVHDAIWILDTVFFPFLPMQKKLQTLTTKPETEPTLRFRALSSISRLIQNKTALIDQSDLDFLTELLQADDKWMRAQAAFALEALRESQLNEARRQVIIQALQSAWQNEEELLAKAYQARALDHYQDSTLHEQLKESYEAQYLANSMSGDRVMLNSGLPQEELPAFISLMVNERNAFFDFMGLSFDTPVSGDLNDTITLILFANKAEYSEYMNAFIGYGANAGGLYLEKEGILYTYQRLEGESRYTVEELVKHEFSHYLQGRYIFPGLWTDAEYHKEIKGWADEGLAEFFAGFTFDESGNYSYSAREAHLDTLCGAPRRDLNSLLNQNEGYNQTGVFDYANGWSFIFYMMTSRSDSAIRLFESFRNDTYKFEEFATIAGVPIENLQQEWHESLTWWCDVTDRDGTSQADFTHGYTTTDGSPFSTANEDIIIHLPDANAPPELFDVPLEGE